MFRRRSGWAAEGAAAVALHGREIERLATRAETASQAPWRAAIAAARGLERATTGARRQIRDQRNDPMRGAAAAGRAVVAGGQTGKPRNDPIRGAVARVRAAGAPLDARVGVLSERGAHETALWVPSSPGLGEALAREVLKRRLRAAEGLCGNDPIRGTAVGAGAGDGGRVAPAVPGLGSTRSLALGSTTLGRTWEPSVAEILAARFGPAPVEGWAQVPGMPSEIAAMPTGGCAQRPYTRSGGPAAVEGWARVPGMPSEIAAVPTGGCAQRPYTRLAVPQPDGRVEAGRAGAGAMKVEGPGEGANCRGTDARLLGDARDKGEGKFEPAAPNDRS